MQLMLKKKMIMVKPVLPLIREQNQTSHLFKIMYLMDNISHGSVIKTKTTSEYN